MPPCVSCSICGHGPVKPSYLVPHLMLAHHWTEEQVVTEMELIDQHKLYDPGATACDLCDKIYYSERSWLEHRKKIHEGRKWIKESYVVCPNCNQKFPDAGDLVRHWTKEHESNDTSDDNAILYGFASGPYVVCPKCQQKFTDAGDLITHWKFEHVYDADDDRRSNALITSLNRTIKQLESYERVASRLEPSSRNKRKRLEQVETNSTGPLQHEGERPEVEKVVLDLLAKAKSEAEAKYGEQGFPRNAQTEKDPKETVKKARTENNAAKKPSEQRPEVSEKRRERLRKKAQLERARRWRNSLILKSYRKQKELEQLLLREGLRQNLRKAASVTYPEAQANAGGVLPAIKNVIAWKERSLAPANMRKAACYAIVGLNTAEEQQGFFDLVKSNGYTDVMFFHDPSPKKTCGAADNRVDLEMRASSSSSQNRIDEDIVPTAAKEEFSDESSSNDFETSLSAKAARESPPLFACESSRTNISVSSKENFHQSSPSGSRQLSCGNNSNGIVSSIKERNPLRLYDTCLVCASTQPVEKMRMSSSTEQESNVLFACLLAQKLVSVEDGIGMYRTIQISWKRICVDHFFKAGEFIGKELEKMCGTFPRHGLYGVPFKVKTDFLKLLLEFGKLLDDKIQLNCGDVARFLLEYLVKRSDRGSFYKLCSEQRTSKSTPKTVCKVTIPSSSDIKDDDKSICSSFTVKSSHSNSEISAMDLIGSWDAPDFPTTVSNPSSCTAEEEATSSPEREAEQDEQQSLSRGEVSTPPPRHVTEVFRDEISQIDKLNDEDFWRRFRVTRKTFAVLCSALEDLSTRKISQAISCPIGIKVGIGLEFLSGGASAFSIPASTATTIFTDCLALLAEWSTWMIHWPNERERRNIGENFFTRTGLRNIVGCIDGTVIKGADKSLNVGLVTDDEKRFRWVLTKFQSCDNNDSVFKKSLLCQQLRNGRKKGRLIGDDAYTNEPFLLTPGGGMDVMSEEGFALATKLRKAHHIIQEAIMDWKRQFPILNGRIRFGRVARIVICCAALYNLSRAEGEPVFGEGEREEQCTTVENESGDDCIIIL